MDTKVVEQLVEAFFSPKEEANWWVVEILHRKCKLVIQEQMGKEWSGARKTN